MLGSDDTSLYVVFMGTKHVRDIVADANLLQDAVWQDDQQQVISTSLLLKSPVMPVCLRLWEMCTAERGQHAIC